MMKTMNKKWSRSYIYANLVILVTQSKSKTIITKNPIVYSANEAYKIQNKGLLDQINSK